MTWGSSLSISHFACWPVNNIRLTSTTVVWLVRLERDRWRQYRVTIRRLQSRGNESDQQPTFHMLGMRHMMHMHLPSLPHASSTHVTLYMLVLYTSVQDWSRQTTGIAPIAPVCNPRVQLVFKSNMATQGSCTVGHFNINTSEWYSKANWKSTCIPGTARTFTPAC